MKMNSRLDDDLLSEGNTPESSPWSIASAKESPYWNIFFLAIAWALTLTTSTLLTSVGPLTAKDLGASQSISAFTVGCFLIGAAVSSVPSGKIFRKYGRMWGFSFGCWCQLVGSVMGVLSVLGNQLFLLFVGCFSIGLGQGLGQFYRFSAIEITPDYLKSRAVTYVLSGGIIAAFLGPTCANYSATLMKVDYMASFMLIAGIAVLNQFTVWMVNFPPPVSNDVVKTETPNALMASALSEHNGTPIHEPPRDSMQSARIRSSYEIVTQPMFIVACTVATIAHTIMVMVMSNVSIAMDDGGYSFAKTSLTLELHFLAMFSPGFFTGALIERYGTFAVALLGAVIFAGSSFVLAVDDQFWNYSVGMVLQGLGWNFSFSAGTVMLTGCYRPIEAAEVQAINDFILFTVAGAGSLISGVLYQAFGWLFLIYLVSGLMAIYLALFAVMWKYAPSDAMEDEDEEDQDCCNLLSSPTAVDHKSTDRTKSHSFAKSGSFAAGSGGGIVGLSLSDPERPGDVVLDSAIRSTSNDLHNYLRHPAVAGSIAGSGGTSGSPYPFPGSNPRDPSRHSSFASSVASDRSARKNSIAEVGYRIAMG